MKKENKQSLPDGVKTRDLERYEESGVNLAKIAEYLGWKLIKDGTEIISKKEFPRVSVCWLVPERQMVIADIETRKDHFSGFVSMENAERVEFIKFQRIKGGRVYRTVKTVTVKSPHAWLYLTSEDPEGYAVFSR